MRSLEVAQSVARHIGIKQRQRGYDEATFVESFVLLNGVGGDCLDDFEQLRADGGLEELPGHSIPSPEAARNFLYEFHSEAHIESAKEQRSLGEIACIPGENAALHGRGEAVSYTHLDVYKRQVMVCDRGRSYDAVELEEVALSLIHICPSK